jgi:zinc protease
MTLSVPTAGYPGLTPDVSAYASGSGPVVSTFQLDNGLTVVVIPDRRVAVVTHMVWYKNGAADDPAGKSGIAHFLEHLMFKGTEKHPAGAFSKMVAAVGGQENAFTGWDYTAYYQRVAPEHLKTMMAFEADRMTGLVLEDSVVAPERDVVIEERRMRTDNSPADQLGEAMFAALYTHHPYGKPIIGWMHEIEDLGRSDALAYYRRFYTPNNATLVVAGDIDHDTVVALAQETYGKVMPTSEAPKRKRSREPEPRAARRVIIADAKVEQPELERLYLTPHGMGDDRMQSSALLVLSGILGGGSTSRLYRTLAMNDGPSVSASAYYYSGMLDDSFFALSATPRIKEDGSNGLAELEAALDREITRFLEDGPTADELRRAKVQLIASHTYAQDSQTSLAHHYGANLTNGLSIDEIATWSERIDEVDADAVLAVARLVLLPHRSVTGWLTRGKD